MPLVDLLYQVLAEVLESKSSDNPMMPFSAKSLDHRSQLSRIMSQMKITASYTKLSSESSANTVLKHDKKNIIFLCSQQTSVLHTLMANQFRISVVTMSGSCNSVGGDFLDPSPRWRWFTVFSAD